MRHRAEELADVQLILMCGHNAPLASRLRAMKAAAPRLIVNFTINVPYFMALSDFFVGKPGPGSISEAFQKRLRSSWRAMLTPCPRSAITPCGCSSMRYGKALPR